MSETRIIEACPCLLRLGQVRVLTLHDLVSPYVVELGQYEENNVEHAEINQTFVRGVVCSRDQLVFSVCQSWEAALTVRLILFAIYIDRGDAANLVGHVVECRSDGSLPNGSGVAADKTDEDRVGVWKAVDACQKSIADPRTRFRLDADQNNEEGKHPDVAAGREEKALVETLGKPAKEEDLLMTT